MRALLPLATLALACRAAPVWEPVGGFELAPVGGPWREAAPGELERWLDEARARLASVRDYSVVLETRERIQDELYPRRVLAVKVREKPFAAVIETLEPANEKGQRVWYDERKNQGALLAETPGLLGRLVGRVSLDPRGEVAMENRRHPITDTGLARLLAQVEAELAPLLAEHPRLRVRTTAARTASLRFVDAIVPREPPDPPLIYRLGFDGELLTYFGQAELLPDGPALMEEYLYRDLRFDLGLEDEDFQPKDD